VTGKPSKSGDPNILGLISNVSGILQGEWYEFETRLPYVCEMFLIVLQCVAVCCSVLQCVAG